MAKALSPQQIAEKQVRRSVASVQDYKDGVMAVKQSPMAKAAERVDAWFQGVQKAYNDGTFVDGLNGVTLQSWQDSTAGKGAMNYPQGVTKAQAVIADFHQQRQQAQAAIDAALASMPRGDLQQNIQRMVAQATGMSQFKFKKRRS